MSQSNRTIRRRFRVDRKEIAYLRFIFEAYDGVAVITTDHRQTGLVSVYIAPGRENEVAQLLAGLKDEIRMEPV